MQDQRTVLSTKDGYPKSGYTLTAYEYNSSIDTSPAKNCGTLIGVYTGQGDGTYTYNFTTTVKVTLVLSSGTDIKSLGNWIGALMEGDNQPTL